jgi:hypothetical protein
MIDDHKQRAAAWRTRMIDAIHSLDLGASTEQYGDRLGDAAEALAELESVRTICAWAEHQATSTANIIENNQRREIRTMEMMLLSLGEKGLEREPIPELERMRLMADLLGRLATIRAEAVQAGIAFAVQLLGETRAYFAQIATGPGGANNDVLSVLVHACMIGEMRKNVAEDLAEDEAGDEAARPRIDAMLDALTRCESDVES